MNINAAEVSAPLEELQGTGNPHLVPKAQVVGEFITASRSQLSVSVAAIRDAAGGVHSVSRPGRHCDVMQKMAAAGHPIPIQGEQGFVLSDGGFASRCEAKTIAMAAQQIRVGMGKFPELYSEDLW